MKKIIFRVASIIVAIIIMSVGLNMFLAPHSIAAGGLTGLSIIIEQLLEIDRAIILLIGNAFVLLTAFFLLGKEVFLNTVIGAMLLPFVVGIVPNIMLVEDIMLSMIMGSVLFGIAVSILYRNNASSGGTAIAPLIFKKYFKLNTSVGLFLIDGVVVVLSLIVFSPEAFFFAVFSIFITSATMHYIENGTNKKKMVFIISEHNAKITEDIMHQLSRGVTLVPVVGAYEKTQTNMLMVTLPSRDYQPLIKIVDRYDPKAFMITKTVSDVHGEGFTYESGTV